MTGLAQRKKRRVDNRQAVEAAWRMAGTVAAQRLVNELRRRVRCPACMGQRVTRDWSRSTVCACCRGAGILRPHQGAADNEHCHCRDCAKRNEFKSAFRKKPFVPNGGDYTFKTESGLEEQIPEAWVEELLSEMYAEKAL